jgi:hypothetical protein
MLVMPISFKSECVSAIKASPAIDSSTGNGQPSPVNSLDIHGVPRNRVAYCGRDNAEMKSAHCSALQLVIRPLGETPSLTECVNVVGVCSVERDSESVGEASNSAGRVGDMTLRSYSSSASESSWKVALEA